MQKMETRHEEGRKLGKPNSSVRTEDNSTNASPNTLNQSFIATCAAEMKGTRICSEATGATSVRQPVKQKAGACNDLRDEQPQDETTCQTEPTETKCRACNRNECHLYEKEGEKLFSVSINTNFNTSTEKVHEFKPKFRCNLHEYLGWLYIMNSPKQCEKCNKHFSLEEQSGCVSLLPSSTVTINTPVNNKEHASQITQKVFEYVISDLCKVLTVESIEIKGKSIEEKADTLNQKFGKEIAYAAAIDNKVYIVFPESGREIVKSFLKQCTNSMEDKFVARTVSMKKVLLKFPSDIESCLDAENTGISFYLEEIDNQCVCKISGPEANVNEAVLKLESFEEDLKHKVVKVSSRIRSGVKQLFVESTVNENLRIHYPNCVFEQTDTNLCIYSFEGKLLPEAATFVREMITEGDTQLNEKMTENMEHLIQHLRNKYREKLFMDVIDTNILYMVGLKEAVEEACTDLVDIKEGRKSCPVEKVQEDMQPEVFEDIQEVRKVTVEKGQEVMQHDIYEDIHEEEHDTTEVYGVRNAKNMTYFENSVFLEKFKKRFKVAVSCIPERFIIEITGSEKDVKNAIESLKKIGQDLRNDCVFTGKDTAGDFLESEAGKDYLATLAKESDVRFDMQNIQIYRSDKLQVSKTEYGTYSVWSLGENRSLNLEQLSVEKTVASVKIIPSSNGAKKGTRVKGQHIVNMGWPTWIDGMHSERKELDKILSQCFNEINESREKSVAIALNPTAQWPFGAFMESIVAFTVEWLIGSKTDKPTSVTLCASEDHFIETNQYIDECVETLIEAMQHSEELRVEVCKGQLDKLKVDVLVNTAAANLDLTKGNVSAAILKTAGPDLQKECRTMYPKGIKHNKIAMTKGYNTGCGHIFHMTLLPYIKTSMENCISNLQQALLLCLKRASELEYTSIAFPAMGTGSLGYPVELIAEEMFGCVERFKKECHSTTLKRVVFVIFHKDVEVFEYFEKMQKKGNATKPSPLQTCKSRQIKIEIIGTQDNVEDAKKQLETKIEELSKDQDTIHTSGNSNTATAVLGQKRDDSTVLSKQISVNRKLESEVTDTNRNHEAGKKECFVRKEERMETEVYGLSRVPKESQPQRRIEKSFSWSQHAKNLKLYECDKCLVRVYEGDLLNVPVDCIVNAANEDLQHCGGLAAAIASAAGETVQQESTHLIQNIGPLKVTSVECTGSGRLPYKCIMHAVGPCLHDFTPITKSNLEKCAKHLKMTIFNCLQLADDAKFTSIAIPSISSGQFGVPKDVCAIQYAKAVKKFCKGKKDLNDIHFVDNNRDMVNIVQKTFKAMITDKKPPPFDINVYMDRSCLPKVGSHPPCSKEKIKPKNTARDRPKNWPKENKPENKTNRKEILPTDIKATYSEGKKKLKCYFPSNLMVQVYEGNILRIQDAEAIVCSENREGTAKGFIAYSLLSEGGHDYRKMKNVQFSRGREYGDVITLPGGKNNFKWVMHAVVSRTNHSQIADIYRNIFSEAETRNIRSLALPILGAGEMDPISSSDVMFSELIQFCNGRKNSPFTVHVVINDLTVANYVKDVFKRRIDEMPTSHTITTDKKVTADVSAYRGSLTEASSDNNVKDKSKDTDETKKEDDSAKDTDGDAKENQTADQDDCVICMDKVTDPMKLRCGHIFCKDCIEEYFRVKKVCPTCGKVCGIITGDQPKGTMEIIKKQSCVAGYERHKSIVITYHFEHGRQGHDHPRPGDRYKQITRTAYLPDNKEGKEICALLKTAFERRLVFTIGASRTTGEEGVITWNDIHHKTDARPNKQFGYPDDTYLQRVREELSVKGVTKEDLDKTFLKQLARDDFRKIIN